MPAEVRVSCDNLEVLRGEEPPLQQDLDLILGFKHATAPGAVGAPWDIFDACDPHPRVSFKNSKPYVLFKSPMNQNVGSRV